jgi:uncharacterized membrane protein (DUF4010 family)
VALSAFLVVNYAHDVRTGAERGLTSEAAFLVSFLLGALALTTDVIRPPAHKFFAVAATAVVAVLSKAAATRFGAAGAYAAGAIAGTADVEDIQSLASLSPGSALRVIDLRATPAPAAHREKILAKAQGWRGLCQR